MSFLATTITMFLAFYALAFVFFLFEVVFIEWAGDEDNNIEGQYIQYY